MLHDLEPGDGGWVISRHGALYAAEHGFDPSFEATVARIVAEFLETQDPSCERGWIARAGETRLGAVFCVREGQAGVAKLRLFLVEPEARGQGLGRRLLEACMGFARAAGYERMRLWTHAEHRAACALYASAGFTCISSEAIVNYGQPLTEQVWECVL